MKIKMTGTWTSSPYYLCTEPARTTQLNLHCFSFMFGRAPVLPLEMEIKSKPSNNGEKAEVQCLTLRGNFNK